MIQFFTIYSLFFLVTALISFFGAFLAWQRRKVKGALEIVWLMIASGTGAFWLIFQNGVSRRHFRTCSLFSFCIKIHRQGKISLKKTYFFIFCYSHNNICSDAHQ